MAKRDIVDDLTDIVHPLPNHPGVDADENELDGFDAWVHEVEGNRNAFEQDVRMYWEEADENPLLRLLGKARAEMLAAEKRMRLLVAYGREFVEPRPYRLDDLAQSTGMSISGTRTAYNDDEIAEVAALLGRTPRPRATGTAS